MTIPEFVQEEHRLSLSVAKCVATETLTKHKPELDLAIAIAIVILSRQCTAYPEALNYIVSGVLCQ